MRRHLRISRWEGHFSDLSIRKMESSFESLILKPASAPIQFHGGFDAGYTRFFFLYFLYAHILRETSFRLFDLIRSYVVNQYFFYGLWKNYSFRFNCDVLNAFSVIDAKIIKLFELANGQQISVYFILA